MQALELTPLQVRKSELMFFWSRYPDLNLLKKHFSDIQDKNKLLLLERRFRCFRNFFYNQLERYAWQAINDGVNSADDLHVDKKSEIYKVFKSHFDHNNNIDIPNGFCEVLQFTLRQYFCHIQSGKINKTEQPSKKVTTCGNIRRKLREILGIQKIKNEINNEESWENFIYTAVSKLDEPVPDDFKNVEFLLDENSSKPLNKAAFTHKLETIYKYRLKNERQ